MILYAVLAFCFKLLGYALLAPVFIMRGLVRMLRRSG